VPVTTTLKLPTELKSRIAPLAEAAGKTPHAWMIEALSEEARRAEARAAFVAEALEAEAETESSGKVYAADEVFASMKKRIAGKDASRPNRRISASSREQN
jgi:predicted transcriptional regulator